MKEKVLGIINIVLANRDKEKIFLDSREDMDLRNDIGLDSLDLAELTVRLEAEFDVDIFEAGYVRTFGEVLNRLTK